MQFSIANLPGGDVDATDSSASTPDSTTTSISPRTQPDEDAVAQDAAHEARLAVAVATRFAAALAAYIATPRDAALGLWSTDQHLDVLRAVFIRSVGLVRSGTLAKLTRMKNVMKLILRFSVSFSTPSLRVVKAMKKACEDPGTGEVRPVPSPPRISSALRSSLSTVAPTHTTAQSCRYI